MCDITHLCGTRPRGERRTPASEIKAEGGEVGFGFHGVYHVRDMHNDSGLQLSCTVNLCFLYASFKPVALNLSLAKITSRLKICLILFSLVKQDAFVCVLYAFPFHSFSVCTFSR